MIIALNVGLIAGESVRGRLRKEVRVKYSGPFTLLYLTLGQTSAATFCRNEFLLAVKIINL